ncbi:Hydantoinase B/oxoprolinase [Parafrankia irregularis]|uniref:Hydantoinase B/oxoprolinase n=1 Tax=Parafrankia irregularis TaxID=795642 RepID=A0A0S4QF69_9ACTN|nr:Hydantoinase B/oxoprolinase [Parafrankia irregularis]
MVLESFAEVLRYGERRSRAVIASLPDGVYRVESELEGDGVDDRDIALRVAVVIAGDSMTVDFSGTSPAVRGNVNCPRAVTRSACCFALRVLLPEDVPTGDGTYAPLTVVTEPGSLVDARRPSAVVAGNVETSQRIADTVLAALRLATGADAGSVGVSDAAGASESEALRSEISETVEISEAAVLPAPGQGTMNNLVIGGATWTYYETLGGGQGASARGPGPSGVHVGMTNTLNTPIEALELEYPLRVERYELADGTGGRGRHAGGAGLVRSVRVLEPATLSVLSDRRRHAPGGIAGGEPGAVGHNDVDGVPLPPKASRQLPAGAVVTLRTPGGGGWGPPPSGDGAVDGVAGGTGGGGRGGVNGHVVTGSDDTDLDEADGAPVDEHPLPADEV